MSLVIIIQENARAVIIRAAGVVRNLIILEIIIALPVTQMMPQGTTIPVSVQPAMRLLVGAGQP